MSQKHYKQLLKETRHVKEVFDTLKKSFYEAINNQEKNSEEETGDKRMSRSLIKYEGMDKEETRYLDETLTILEMFREEETQNNQTRKRRFFAELGTILTGAGVYANYKTFRKLRRIYKFCMKKIRDRIWH